ncbi:MAG: DUF1566 domain-containing protein, partial [Deltaproteobacteria bacterium]
AASALDTSHATNAGTLTDARSGHSATLLANGSVLVAGGCADSLCMRTLPSIEIWTAGGTGGAFHAGATMPGARHNHTATTLATGEILFAGGANGATSSLPSAEVYIPTSDRWISVEGMHLDRAYHAAALLNSSNVLLAGGCNPQTCMPWAEVFSPARLPGLIADAGTPPADAAVDVPAQPDVVVSPVSPHPLAYRQGAHKCQNNTTQQLDCPLSAYPLQDPDFQPNDASYGPAGPEIRDNVSGLIWQGVVDTALVDQAGAVAFCATYSTPTTAAGQWRLPNVVELATLVHYGVNSPSIDPRFVGTQSTNYWTTTPVGSGSTQTWTVKFDFGEVIAFGNAHQGGVRCVHGAMPDTDAGVPGRLRQAGSFVPDGLTVRDPATGLEWQREDDGVRRSWQDSQAYCATLNLAGRTGWHTPNVGELRSLVEYGGVASGPTIDPVFTNARADLYWTGTPNDGVPTLSWSVTFNLGVIDGVTVTGLAFVRCVRHLDTVAPDSGSEPTTPPSGCRCRVTQAGSSPSRTTRGLASAGLALAAVVAGGLSRRRRRA